MNEKIATSRMNPAIAVLKFLIDLIYLGIGGYSTIYWLIKDSPLSAGYNGDWLQTMLQGVNDMAIVIVALSCLYRNYVYYTTYINLYPDVIEVVDFKKKLTIDYPVIHAFSVEEHNFRCPTITLHFGQGYNLEIPVVSGLSPLYRALARKIPWLTPDPDITVPRNLLATAGAYAFLFYFLYSILTRG